VSILDPPAAPTVRYPWGVRGDINAFFGLMLDNLGDMILMAALLVKVFGMPVDFVLTRMIPGTAVGVMVGDLIYSAMAFRLARKLGRSDVTAMPLGLDTPSTFGMVFLILGPAYKAAQGRGLTDGDAANHAWFVGVSMILASGVFKLACSLLGPQLRRVVPRAGLLGSLTAISLVIISFLPLLDIASQPIAGFAALGIVLVTLTARWELPGRMPGALASVVVGCLIYYGLWAFGFGPGLGAEGGVPSTSLRASLPIPVADWFAWFRLNWGEASNYLPVALPLALATVIGGIDCTESASVAGDEYSTGPILAADAIATLAGGLFGGVIQSTAYIGHPAYKAMGARAGYTIAVALFVGAAGIFGFFDWIFYVLPRPVVFPILIFVGLEITSQSFRATPSRYYPAVTLACVPALAYLASLAVGQVLPETGKPFAQLSAQTQQWVQTVTMLSGGFIVTSLIWSTTLSHLIDGKIRPAVLTLLVASVCSFFGIIHSGLPSGPLLMPAEAIRRLKVEGRYGASTRQTPYHWAAAYATLAAVLLVVGRVGHPPEHEVVEEPRTV
jgi:AGZA family xanthine/uracil permease-like MFS transporter